MILVIDNYDSFTFNLVQALQVAGARVEVVRNDALDRAALEDYLEDRAPELSGLLVSPGPGNPSTAGVSVDAIRLAAARRLPTLGVCLGHQCIAAAYGAAIRRAPSLVHGEASDIRHDGAGVLDGLASPFRAGRYHSLCIDPGTLPPELEATAWTADGVIMAIRHRELPIEGVQFHPESVLTPDGPHLLENFLGATRERRGGEATRAGAGTA